MARTDGNTSDTGANRHAKALQAFIDAVMNHSAEITDHPLPDIELSPREAKVLLLLGDRGTMIMTDLATASSAPLSTITRVIDRLENKQMIERFRSTEDRRIVMVKESGKGKRLRECFRRNQLDTATRLLQPLSNRERETLIELIDKLTVDRTPNRAHRKRPSGS